MAQRDRQPAERGTDAPALCMTVVRYENAPDHCTVYPPDAADVERVSTWLSADREHVRSLAAMR